MKTSKPTMFDYKENARMKRYVDRYCTTHNCSVEVALTHKLVIMYWEYISTDVRVGGPSIVGGVLM